MLVVVKNPSNEVLAYANQKFLGSYKLDEERLFLRVSTVGKAFKTAKTLKLLSPNSLVKILIP